MGCHMSKHLIGIHGTGDWVSQCNGRVRVRVGQVNRVSSAISGAVYSNWSQDHNCSTYYISGCLALFIYHDII